MGFNTLIKSNDNHDDHGRFASGSGAGGVSPNAEVHNKFLASIGSGFRIGSTYATSSGTVVTALHVISGRSPRIMFSDGWDRHAITGRMSSYGPNQLDINSGKKANDNHDERGRFTSGGGAAAAALGKVLVSSHDSPHAAGKAAARRAAKTGKAHWVVPGKSSDHLGMSYHVVTSSR